MEGLAAVEQLTPIDLSLEAIQLDPNNPRFAEFGTTHVADSEIEAAQQRVQDLLKQRFQVDKLIMSMSVNGFLPMDRVIVRRFDEDKYVVLEGNRRICAAKLIVTQPPLGGLDDSVEASFQSIPCLLYTGTDPSAAWIFQGLRHITGVLEWSAFNKAYLLVEQMEEEELTLTQVGQRYGLTAHGAGQWVRGYRAFKQAKEESDYVAEITEEAYPYFQEIFSHSSIPVREWLKWSEPETQFKDGLALNEYVSWLYPRPLDNPDAPGDWEKRRIARRDDIRVIADLIKNDPDVFQQFRDGMELEKAYSLAQARKFEEESKKNTDAIQDTFDALDTCIRAMENLPWSVMRNVEHKARLLQDLEKLDELIGQLRTDFA